MNLQFGGYCNAHHCFAIYSLAVTAMLTTVLLLLVPF
jgi:hypothetical protein